MVRSIDKYLSKGFYKYAGLVHRFWPWFIAVPLVLCVPCIAGFTFMKARRQGKYETTEYIFTPTNADSLYEKACIAEHWPLDFNRYLPGKSSQVKRWIEVLIVAKDNGNLLRSEYIEEAFRAGEFILNNLTVKGLDDNTKIGYEQLCMKWDGECFSNIQLALLKERKAISKYFTLTYPIANLEVAPVYVANLLGGVEINSNGTVRSVKGVRMLFALIHEPDVFDVLSLQWTYALQHYIEAYKGNYTDMAIFHSKSLDDGLEDNALTLVPRFSVSMMVLVIFSVLCSLTTVQVPHWRIPLIDWHKSRVILAVGGVLCAGVGIAAAMGFLMLVGTPYNPIVAVMPFLVIAIGIDDMFIIMSGWRNTDNKSSVPKRLAHCLSEAAVSITVTTTTDVFSFGIGTVTNIPGVQIFCIYTGVALWFTYLMQMTVFTAMMVLSGQREEQGWHCLFWGKARHPENCDSILQMLFLMGSVREKEKAEVHDPKTCFASFYVPLLMHPASRIVTLFIGVAYLAFGLWGCAQLREGLEPKNLLVETNHAVKWYTYSEKYFFPEGHDLQVVVNNPPTNLSDPIERQHLLNVVSSFENTTYTMASNATQFWLRDYLRYLANVGFNLTDPLEINAEEIWTDRLKYWIDRAAGTPFWQLDIVWRDPTNQNLSANNYTISQPQVISAMRFTIGLRNFVKPNQHMGAAILMRQIASGWPKYNITTFHAYWPFVDQYLQVKPNTFQDIGIGICCMLLIAALLIPSVITGLLIVVSIISIDIGVIGFMTWWNVNLDAISMITLIMCMGFAVDQTAHVSYGYISSSGSTQQRTITALNNLGWPMLQGSLSAILGVFMLSTVHAYTLVTFFKTVLLAMTFGAVHGLLFLPVLLSVFVRDSGPLPCRKKTLRISEPNKQTVTPLPLPLPQVSYM